MEAAVGTLPGVWAPGTDLLRDESLRKVSLQGVDEATEAEKSP